MKNKEVAENNSQLIQYMVSPEEAFAVCQKEQSILLSQQAAINEAIKTHLHSLTRFISYLEGSIHKAPEGFLRIHAKRNLTNYYYYHPKERGCGQYLPFQSNEKLIRALCQKSYDQKLLSAAKHALVSLQKVSSLTSAAEFRSVYDKETPARKLMITPYILSDEDFVRCWKAAHTTQHTFREQDKVYNTDQNERVRSKSEVIIANALNSMGIPYCYEPILSLGQTDYRPDFIVLNVRTRKEYYWEHLGMMDDKDYQDHSYRKIAVYEQNGIIPGVNLILSFESTSMPLYTPLIKQLIQQFCL